MSTASANPVVSAFTLDQASRLTGVSVRQLGYWANDGFFIPSVRMGEDTGISVRLYSFRDLVCLKVINVLRNEAQIPLSHLREVKESLSHLGDDMWAKTTLYILGRRVVFDNPETGKREDAGNGQGVLQIPLVLVTGDMREAIRSMRRRESSNHGQIDLKRLGTKNPVIAGTRIQVRTIQDFANAGYSVGQIIKQYPSLTEADVNAAISFRIAA